MAKKAIERWELGRFFGCRIIEDNSATKVTLPTEAIKWLQKHGYLGN